jgi:multidrug efflux pump
MGRMEAAFQGAREVGFTVLSMSLSLVAVFIPILLMGGIVGRLFREFALTLSIAVLVSLVVSLTTTPMMCAYLVKPQAGGEPGRLARLGERGFDAVLSFYERSLRWALSHCGLMMLLLAAVLGLNFYLFAIVPKGFFPQQDTGRLVGGIQADQSISFQRMRDKLAQFVAIVQKDPAVESVVGFTGGSQTNSGFVFVALKPVSDRPDTADQVIARLRRNLSQVAGARLFLQAVQDIRVGGRQSNAAYQYTLEGDDLAALYAWAPKITEALQQVPELTDVNSDQQQNGLEADISIDRATASRLGLTASQVDATLYDAFGQRQVSTIYNPLNQYHVVMEVAPRFSQSPDALDIIYVSTSGGAVSGTHGTNAVAGTTTGAAKGNQGTATSASQIASDTARNQASNALANSGRGSASTGAAVSTAAETMVPLSAFVTYVPGKTPLAVSHHGTFVAATVSFNLAPGKSLSDAVTAIDQTMNRIGVPSTIHGNFAGTARTFQASLANEPILILAAIAAVYIVLGVLYESYVHPITILSTLPSAGLGAVLALMICNIEFSIIALIGVILLIGIVKKNAIMMIDVAVATEREEHLTSYDAIYRACILRFRPIMMTTMAALLGALPLALGLGEGAELRRPLGISIVGGLIVSQMLTLYTTPVIYLYLDRFRLWSRAKWRSMTGQSPLGDMPSAGE